jgi:hypothetical protein
MAHHPGWNLAPGLPSGMRQDDASASAALLFNKS